MVCSTTINEYFHVMEVDGNFPRSVTLGVENRVAARPALPESEKMPPEAINTHTEEHRAMANLTGKVALVRGAGSGISAPLHDEILHS